MWLPSLDNSEAARAEVIALLFVTCGGWGSLPVVSLSGPVVLIDLVVTLASCRMARMCTGNLRYVVDDVDVVINRLVLALVASWTSCSYAALIHDSYCWRSHTSASCFASTVVYCSCVSCSCVFVVSLVRFLVELGIQFDTFCVLLLFHLLRSVWVTRCGWSLLEITVAWSVHQLALMMMSMWHSSLRW